MKVMPTYNTQKYKHQMIVTRTKYILLYIIPT